MGEVLQLMLACLLLFGGALAFAWCLGVALERWRTRAPALEPGAILRLRAATGVYRTRMRQATGAGWIVDAPLQAGAHVPLRPGEALYVEAPLPHGVLRFKSTLIAREADPHRFLITRPKHPIVTERRSEVRDASVMGVAATVNGRPAELLNLSPNGAALVTRLPLSAGDPVSLEASAIGLVAEGWVLSALPSTIQGQCGSELRLCFEAPIELKKKAPRLRGP